MTAAALGVGAVVAVASGRDDTPAAPDLAGAPARAGPPVAEAAPLDDALLAWLEQLCALHADCPKGGATARSRDAKPVHAYVVSTEGGGIRAAYWTALVLARLSIDRPEFAQRTFSVSGVSGGAIGAAVWRACWQREVSRSVASPVQAKPMLDCVDQLGRADLLTPLASAWLFEDVLGRFIPTAHGAASRGVHS